MRVALVLMSPRGIALHQQRLPSLPLTPGSKIRHLVEILLHDLLGSCHGLSPRQVGYCDGDGNPVVVFEAYWYEAISYLDWADPSHEFTPWENLCIEFALKGPS
jgi:hypothetical protein